MDNPKIRLLFLCTNNAVRSIMAEALLRAHGGERFQVYSAGNDPLGTANPHAIALLKEAQYFTDDLWSKSWDEFTGAEAPPVDVIITLSHEVASKIRAVQPAWNGSPIMAHWGLPAPVQVEGDDATKRQAFAATLQRIQRRLDRLLALPVESLDRIALNQHLKVIGGEDAD